MNKNACIVQISVFLLFITLFLLLNIFIPDVQFSEQENRYLQQAPSFSFGSLFSGKYTEDFEKYLTDQFSFRDSWITLKARVELLLGKNENNGYFLCKDDTIIEPYSEPDFQDLDFSLDAIRTLATETKIPVYFALIPSACEIEKDYLPQGCPSASQQITIDYAYEYLKKNKVHIIDISNELLQHKTEPIYYRTDHHWTTLGAYYGYSSIINTMEISPVPLNNYTMKTVTDSFYGTAYSGSGFTWVEPDSISTYVEQGTAKVTNYSSGEGIITTMYDESCLKKKDKYSYFYGGNSPLITIETELCDAPSLLVLRDSYFDSLSPFLTAHFSEIHILDLRYYRSSLREYIEKNNIDNILVCYNVKNFCDDGNIFLAAY